MTSNSTLQKFETLKKEGNAYFTQSTSIANIENYIKANEIFREAIKEIEESEYDFNSPESEYGKLFINLLNNSALSSINLKTEEEYLAAIESCDKTLRVDPDNLKGLYRRALAYKELGQTRQIAEKMEGVLQQYLKSKTDLERLCLLDRQNKVSIEKLNEVNKNVARLKVLNKVETVEIKSNKISTNKVQKGHQKVSIKMQNIMKNYKIQQVVKAAQQQNEQNIVNSDLPKSKTQLDKAVKLLKKKPELLKTFFLKFKEGYLQKLDPGFDVLFQIVTSLITVQFTSNIQQFSKIVTDIIKTKSFTLLWKGFIESQKKDIRSKLDPIFTVHPELTTYFK